MSPQFAFKFSCATTTDGPGNNRHMSLCCWSDQTCFPPDTSAVCRDPRRACSEQIPTFLKCVTAAPEILGSALLDPHAHGDKQRGFGPVNLLMYKNTAAQGRNQKSIQRGGGKILKKHQRAQMHRCRKSKKSPGSALPLIIFPEHFFTTLTNFHF